MLWLCHTTCHQATAIPVMESGKLIAPMDPILAVQGSEFENYGVVSNEPLRFGVGFAYVFMCVLKMMIIIVTTPYELKEHHSVQPQTFNTLRQSATSCLGWAGELVTI